MSSDTIWTQLLRHWSLYTVRWSNLVLQCITFDHHKITIWGFISKKDTSRSLGIFKRDIWKILSFRKNLLLVFEINSLELAMFDGKLLGFVGLRESHTFFFGLWECSPHQECMATGKQPLQIKETTRKQHGRNLQKWCSSIPSQQKTWH